MHARLKEILAKSGREFMKLICRDVLNWDVSSRKINYRAVEGLAFREDGNADGRAFGIDFIVITRPGVDGVEGGLCTTIGFIIVPEEEQADDLCNKVEKCFGWTNYLILITTSDLVGHVEEMLDNMEAVSPSNRGRTGLMSLDSLFPIRRPRPSTVPSQMRAMLFERVILSSVFKETKEKDAISLEDFPILEMPTNGMRPETDVLVEDPREPSDEMPVGKPTPEDDAEPTDGRKKRSKEKKETIRKKAAENKERRMQMSEEVSARNLSLADSTRAVVSSLSQRDQIVFWRIADSGKDGGMNAKGIVLSTNESAAGVNRSIKTLKKLGLVIRKGSRKTGRYILSGDALLRSRCFECKNKSKCRGIASKCPSFSHSSAKFQKTKQ